MEKVSTFISIPFNANEYNTHRTKIPIGNVE